MRGDRQARPLGDKPSLEDRRAVQSRAGAVASNRTAHASASVTRCREPSSVAWPTSSPSPDKSEAMSPTAGSVIASSILEDRQSIDAQEPPTDLDAARSSAALMSGDGHFDLASSEGIVVSYAPTTDFHRWIKP